MKLRIPLLSALLGAATFATAQTQSAPPAEPAPTVLSDSLTLADQPMFSTTSGSQSPNLPVAEAIVQALAADPSLKGSKVTVQPEENAILLTGVTPTVRQMDRVGRIASQHAGDARVINAINSEEVFIAPNPTGPVGTEQVNAEDAPDGQMPGLTSAMPRAK